MEKYLIRPKPKATTVVAGTASKPSTSSTCTGSEVQTNKPKRKKKPVKNEATIKSWQLDWLEVEKAKGDAPALTAFCKACREFCDAIPRGTSGRGASVINNYEYIKLNMS